jgi:uncharacterized protein
VKRPRQPEDFPHPEMTPEEAARCAPATETDHLASPIPTHLVSNGEFFPPFLQTQEQKRVERRILDLSGKASKKLGLNRRQFLATSVGMATAFVAINEVFRKSAFGQDLFKVNPEELYDPSASAGPPSDLFVFDDQTHIVRGQSLAYGYAIGTLLRVLAQGETARTPNSPFPVNPLNAGMEEDEAGETWGNWNPRLIDNMNWNTREYWLHNYIKHMYFESQTTVCVISNVASGQSTALEGATTVGTRNVYEARAQELLTAEQTFACKDFINEMAGSTRALAHGLLYMGPGNIHYLQEQVERFGPDAWKGYQNPVAKRDDDPNTAFETWRFDDEELAFPTFEFLRDNYRRNGHRKPGQNCVAVHKGLGQSSRPEDIPAAARAFPELNFVIYHSCIRPSFFSYAAWEDVLSGRLREGVPDILDVAEFAQTVAPYGNVYAELGTIWASVCATFPTVGAHILGILFKYLGADRIVWGTDSTWYGDPQWQIEAFWRFRMPDEFKKLYCYPEITDAMKRKVMGLNSARLFRMSPDLSKYGRIRDDFTEQMFARPDLLTIMEYDDYAPNEVPVEGGGQIPSVPLPSRIVVPGTDASFTFPEHAKSAVYGTATAQRNDRLELLRRHYAEAAGTKFGVPRTNIRHGFIRVR